MITVVTFDLDDTLWDVSPAIARAEQAQNDWLGVHFPAAVNADLDAFKRAVKQQVLNDRPDLRHHISAFRQEYLRRLLVHVGVSEEEALRGAAGAFAAFITQRHRVALFGESRAMLQKITTQFTIGALTNGNADVYQTPLADFFDFAIKAEDVGGAKPLPHLFEAALRHTNVQPSALVHVGDSHDHDIDGAKNAGVRAIWYNSSGDVSDRADASIQCLSELPDVLARMRAPL
ncbi:HAD-superfamily hydrolase, subfamily IA, variant 3:HAD-superfamily hydrolase, subfamily IA, variant 1 [Luminiphilus syltensis NOR5-1B]|uniref:HAD-superfamily hydrolase, subfamily IA, variant 3:HAD-superfamily hydrolase, subfamily IA, variant 1 n=1 Tax=Luminiphilus syltensis NOR5-1B TaxID=565045 RepID=B8KSV4_9GAMM|nr:HAD family hydrolase [Luminiphilus syltensis]EED34998.1 HAD-superfamily hydrolase, subfamily IA, variant 3:HAD-superfamily hydrolase, subfamily IA, variant 1 [Luminiphilus syltensis NOR5-1B]